MTEPLSNCAFDPEAYLQNTRTGELKLLSRYREWRPTG